MARLLLAHLLACVVLAAALASPPVPSAAIAARADAAPDREALLRGVTEIAAPGVPGPLVVFGEGAFIVATGRESREAAAPVVAGGRLGDGRIVAFGHTGYLDAPALEVEQTGVLIDNAIAWLAGAEAGGARPKVAILRNEPLAAALRDRGHDAASVERTDDASLATFRVLLAGAHGLDGAQRESVQAFVRRGGGLITAGLGWGWLQLNPGKTIREHPGNLLLADAGIAWADGTLDRTGKDGFTVGGDIAAECHALRALAAMEHAAAAGESKISDQAAATISAAVRTVPRSHEIVARCRELLREREASLAPTPDSPLGRGRGLERALLALQVELEKELSATEIRAHPSAPGFPGAVPAEALRVTHEVEIETRPGVAAWHSTGLYAAPGETITLTVPPGTDATGLSVRIGCHTDHLWHLPSWRRVPDISRVRPLVKEGATTVASPFGGLIYVETSGARRGRGQGEPPAATHRVPVTIAGAVESPRYVLGETTKEAWSRIRGAPAPWGEIQTSKIIVTVPSEFLRDLDDPAPVARFWDRISDAHADLATIPHERARQERFVADVQISAGYMHAGYPIMTHLDAAEDMVSEERLRRGSWGLLHELGHNHQDPMWTFDGTGEVTVNLFSLYAIDTVCEPPAGSRGHPGVDKPPSWRAYADRGAKFEEWKRDPFLALHMYVQLEREFGWETYKRIFAEYRQLSGAERPRTEEEKRDQWMVRFSRACGRNLGPFFQAWGVPTSEAARASIADLPLWMPEEMTPSTPPAPEPGR